jgi:hypothetical protein
MAGEAEGDHGLKMKSAGEHGGGKRPAPSLTHAGKPG